ncbi:hypothetical protein SAMN05192529_10421 [Arachidicoccus rhizosphaerae]|uniref:Uncharacterized protein n=2 Tax=Arachidicoccus rhizosphaerae TaxID=551991 RepID=A0A1H3WV31_9BACT|nr:hypothetical protein SAMN05192529_10421 [Arachidicoccus rhizosphaerae]
MPGCFFAMLSGYFSYWFIPVFIITCIALGYLYLSYFMKIWSKKLDQFAEHWQFAGKIRMITGTLLAIGLFWFGFLLPYLWTGNVDGLTTKIRQIPAKITWRYIGNFEAQEFHKAFKRAVAAVGDQPTVFLFFYRDYSYFSAEDKNKKGRYPSIYMHGNSRFSYGFDQSPDNEKVLFKAGEVSEAALDKVLQHLKKHYNLRQVLYIGIDKNRRWGLKGPDGLVHNEVMLDIRVVFNGGHRSLKYDGRTGDFLQEKVY